MIWIWILIVSGAVSIVGFWAYSLELLQGRVARDTRWSELNSYQVELVFITLGSVSVFLLTLLISVITQ